MYAHFESSTRIQPPSKSFGSVTLWCSARRSLTFLEFSKPQFPASCWLRSAAEKIIGKHFSVFYPQEARLNDEPRQILARAVRHGQSEGEGWRVRKDGSLFWANVVVTALRDSNGHLLGFAKLTRDTTEDRERAEALTKAK